jgi:D-glutamate cyclase
MRVKGGENRMKDYEYVGESVDRLVNLDVRPPHLEQGLLEKLYHAARAIMNRPLTLLAAERLKEVLTPDSTVIISTGFVIPPHFPVGEMDGPPGAVAVGRIINRGIGSKVLFLTETAALDVMRRTCAGAGMKLYDYESFKGLNRCCSLLDFPIDRAEARKEVSRLLKEHKPSAILTFEKTGRNKKGVYHTALGSDMSGHTAKVDLLVDAARDKGVLTIGVGDYGNEIGFGVIEDTVRESTKYGKKCQCPCGGGMGTSVKTDVVVVASMSNWGGYGIETCLAVLLGDLNLIHDSECEKRIIEQCSLAGASDGPTNTSDFLADGIGIDGHRAMVTLLKELARRKTEKIFYERG